MRPKGTYVYCLVAARRRPSLRRVPPGLPSAGVVRLVEVPQADGRDLRQWLVVADAPLDRFNEAAINRRLRDLDWVARAAMAHEAVVESFVDAAALVPMRLFTIYRNDDRALQHIDQRRSHLRTILKRVAHHDEWGIRVAFDAARAVDRGADARGGRRVTGAAFLKGKKAMLDATLAARSGDVARGLYDDLARKASLARRRSARELPVKSGPLLLDASFLVARARSRQFRAAALRERARLDADGFVVTLTGPWPPYSFLE
jgi:hypothetical protein